MDTVLGLSLTSTTVGWVLVEGHGADGAIVDHDEFAVSVGGGPGAVKTSNHVAAAVLRAEEAATSIDDRLHVIGVTWSDDAAAGAALLVEKLTAAGFENVVPVRWVEAAETLAQGLVPVVGYDKTAVCVVERDSATVVMVDGCDDEMRTAVKQVAGGNDGLFRWLTKMFSRNGWRPDGVVVVGSDAELEEFSSELDCALPVPVFTQGGPELALARGAALASAQGAGFTEAQVVESAAHADDRDGERVRFRMSSSAGALTALVAASVTLVGSLSLAVGLRLAPDKPATHNEAGATTNLVHAAAAPRVAQAPLASPAPVVAPPAAKPAPASAPQSPAVHAPAPLSEQPAAGPPASVAEQPAAVVPAAPAAVPPPPVPDEPPPDPHPLLTRVLEQLRGHQPDAPPPDEPPSP